MEMEIVIPAQIAVMTLPDVAFFPHALMPLHIFEPRYREMLRRVLATHRLFAVAGMHPASEPGEERLHRISTVGIVRACSKNDDDTSNLLLQGLARVECIGIVREEPYRVIQVRTLSSSEGATPDRNEQLRRSLERLITLKRSLGASVPRKFSDFLSTVSDPETYIDLAAFTLCENPGLKQRLLETLDVNQRLQLFAAELRRDVETLKLRHRLQGDLPDDAISLN